MLRILSTKFLTPKCASGGDNYLFLCIGVNSRMTLKSIEIIYDIHIFNFEILQMIFTHVISILNKSPADKRQDKLLVSTYQVHFALLRA